MNRLSTRIGIITIAALAASLGLVLTIELGVHRKMVHEQVLDRYKPFIKQIERTLFMSMKYSGKASFDEILGEIAGTYGVEYIALTDIEGNRLHSAGRTETYETTTGPASRSAPGLYRKLAGSPEKIALEPAGQERIVLRKALSNNESCKSCHAEHIPRAFLEAVVNTTTVSDEKGRETALLAMLLIVQACVFCVMWLFVHRWLLQPLKKFVATIDTVATGKMSERAEVPRIEELATVAHHFNGMLDELEKAREAVQRQYSQSMARVERLATVGQMAASATHELKNLVGAVAGGLELLERLPELRNHKELLDELRNVTNRLLDSARQLLDFSKPVTPVEGPQNVNDCIMSVIGFLGPRARKKGIEMKAELEQALPEARADMHQLQQVLLNLILNAMQAMADGGTIRISSRLEDGRVIVSVEDDGLGMDDDVRQKVFEPFFTTRKDGTGLGLPIAKQMVEAVGGSLALASEPGRGTTVTIALQVWPQKVPDLQQERVA
ncbi:MAG: HAMP domain-containing protein [Deltaproteobacteria bacterium]|nr:MAG: HAMP domain-containing protein [Deltaproteobacteria bacterium]